MSTVMSIFGVDPRRVGGVETFARELSLQLANYDWTSVLCFANCPTGPVRQFLDQANVRIEVLKEAHRPSLATLKRLHGLLRKHRPQILHLHFISPISFLPWLGRLYSVDRIYFTDQASRPEGYIAVPAPKWKQFIARAVNRPLDRFICVSDYNLQCVLKHGLIASGRACRIYNSVDVRSSPGDGIAFKKRYGIPDDRAVVLQVSWLIPEKGIPDLLEAAHVVLARGANVQFVIAGDGSHRAEYEGLANEMGIAPHITWTGLIEDPLAEGLYDAADVVCLLSRWQEAFGWVIAEAMLCRKPLIATQVGGIPEVVDDGHSGFLVAPRKPEEVAAKILLLLNDPPLRYRMGMLGRERVELRFSLERNVRALLDLYGVYSAEGFSRPGATAGSSSR
jgi:glycosyltransferase involved in cell wall biosynthesis